MQGGAVVACEAHNLEVGGSSPSPATICECRLMKVNSNYVIDIGANPITCVY